MAAEYDPMTDHYVALGVGSMASHDEIKKAHRALIRELHPDCGGDAMPAAQVNIARDVLLNVVTREEYDRARREWHEQHLLASAFTEAGMQIHRERTQPRASTSATADTVRRTRQGSSARAKRSTSHAEASDPTNWQPYLARALLAGRFFRTAEDRQSFAAGVAIGAANLLDNIIKQRVGDNPALREVVEMLSHAIWTEHVRVSKATTEQATGQSWDPKVRDASPKAVRSVRSSRRADAQRRRDQNQAPSRRRRSQDGVRGSGSR